jgi:hypothetical protein
MLILIEVGVASAPKGGSRASDAVKAISQYWDEVLTVGEVVSGNSTSKDLTVRFEDVRDVGSFLFAGGWIVVVFANSGVITNA